MNSIGKIMEIEVTEADVNELRAQGVPENDIPAVGSKRRYVRARHISKRSEQKIKTDIYLDGDILDFLRERSKESYEAQINAELRKIMEAERLSEQNETTELQRKLLNDQKFLRELKEKLRAA